MDKPLLLDLFCGAGGASKGYYQAGFEVIGVDIKPQPHYPFEFHLADALTYPLEGFNAYHASPPCQAYTRLTEKKYRHNHPDLIAYVRLRLALHKPFIIENVPDAKDRLWHPIMLCGTMFGLRVYRHRYFEINPEIFKLLTPCCHHKNPILVSGTTRRKAGRVENSIKEKQEAMGIDWMTGKELDQAIPPAYTEYIGKYLIEAMDESSNL